MPAALFPLRGIGRPDLVSGRSGPDADAGK